MRPGRYRGCEKSQLANAFSVICIEFLQPALRFRFDLISIEEAFHVSPVPLPAFASLHDFKINPLRGRLIAGQIFDD